jgi:hypothetical protein
MMMERLGLARSCYDHLAGRLGVTVTEALMRNRLLAIDDDAFDVTVAGEQFFGDLGIDVNDLRARHRSFGRACLDWTERRPHLAGSLGAALLQTFLERGWVVRDDADRMLHITAEGEGALRSVFGVHAYSAGVPR